MDNKIIAATLKVDADQAQKNVLKLKGTVEELRKEFKKAEAGTDEQLAALKKLQAAEQDLAKAQKELAAATDTGFKSFKQQIREATLELHKAREAFGELSPEALAAAKKVADLKDNIKDASEVANLFDPGAKFQVFGNVISTVAGGFSALTGAMAVFGDQGEDVAKTLAKVQGALAFSQGLSTIADSVKDFERLNAVIQQTVIFQKANAVATKVAAATQRLFGIAVDETSLSFKVLKGAIIATGFGALVVLIGEVINLTQEWTSATEKQAEAQKQLKEQTEKLAEVGLKAEMDFISRQEKLDVARAKARGASEKELFKIQEQAQQSRINSQKRHYKEVAAVDEVAGEESLKLVKNLETDKEVARLTFEADQRKKAEEEEKKRQEKAKQDAQKRKEELKTAAERQKAADEELRKLRAENNLLEIEDEKKRAREKLLADADAERQRIKQLQVSEETRANLILETNRKLRDQLNEFDKQTDEEQKAKDAEKLQRNLDYVVNSITQAAQLTKEQVDLRTELEDQEKDEFEKQLQSLDKWYKDKQAIAGANEQLQNELTASYERQRSKIVESENAVRLDMVGNFLKQGADLLGKQTAAGKALAVAAATIDTYKAANSALKADYGIFGPAAQIARFVAVAATIATGLKNVKEIVKTQVPGGGGSSTSSPSIPAVSATAAAPITPEVASTKIDQDSINSIGNVAAGGINAVRAYVVEQDSAEAAARAARLQGAAVLGG